MACRHFFLHHPPTGNGKKSNAPLFFLLISSSTHSDAPKKLQRLFDRPTPIYFIDWHSKSLVTF